MNQEDRGLPHRSGPIEVLGSASVSSGAVCMSFHELSYSNKTHPSRSSPAPTPSTQRTACDADRVGRLVDAAVRRCGGAELTRGLTRSGQTVEAPSCRQTWWTALFRLRTAAQAGLRPMLAFRGRDERVGSSKRKTHPSRGSPAPTPSTQRTACHADRFGRFGVAVWRCGANARNHGSSDA